MNSQYLRFPLLVASLLAALSPFSLSAAPVTWTGNGDANNSGDWVTPSNWSAYPTSADFATLGNVTSSSRTVTIKNGETANAGRLIFDQATSGSSNILTIASGGLLTGLSGSQTWAAPTAGTTTVNVGGTIEFTGGTGAFAINTGLNFTDNGAIIRSISASATPAFTFGGAVNVAVGSGGIAQISNTNTGQTLGATFGAASTLTVTSGTLEFFSARTFGGVGSVTTTLQGTTSIASGATLKLAVTSAAGIGSAGVALTNSGTLTQSGKVTTSSRGGGGPSTITNSGTWAVSGSGVIEKLTNTASTAVTVFTNTGTLRGSTTSDSLNYDHEVSAGSDLIFTNSGIIAAGNGSNGSGLTSVGTLTFIDFNITHSVTTSSLVFDIGGTTGGQFDVIALQSSQMALTNATLAINLVNGFTPSSSFALDILTSDVPSSISGSFVGITVNGSANPNYSFNYNSTTGIGTLSYNAIPEPSTYAAAAGLLSLGAGILRRRRTVKVAA
ncbi:beta strand repeat-containing protein [Rariglobus hedericola]|uniref:PEP-CTERM sorting domain-containing protein n=1 Tax=Rariglobus hedericola TaxID=2597822 RepID=A0A556QEK7_9BACT|nr:hypothetical protein [Rariglobus hedericola]TSJ75041.1 hypothetical protein FPL22_16720 [Rariglobus hedericola]